MLQLGTEHESEEMNVREVVSKKDVLSAQSMYVVKDNALIQKSRYSFSLLEQKAILFLISKIKPQDEPFTQYVFDFSDFCMACNMNKDGGFYIKYIKEIMTNIASKHITISLNDGRTLITHWFSSAIIDNMNDNITITFDNNITPYLFSLHSFYTQYSLEYVLPMKSKYGIRLFEYLTSIKSKSLKQTISIDELRERIDCYKYPNFKDFRVKVIEPAMNDINMFSDLRIKFEYMKTGRKITHIEFTILRECDIDETMERMVNRRKVLGSIR